MKNYYLLIIYWFSLFTLAQVGVGTSNPDPSSILDVSSASKGILMPRVDIGNVNSISPITTAKTSLPNSLLVYNTNTTTTKGFYYWKTESSSWVPLVDTERIVEQIPMTIFYNSVSSNSTNVSASSWVTTPTSPNSGDIVDGTWTLISGLETTITITKPTNIMSIMSEGIAQVDDKSESSQSSSYSYNVAITIQKSGQTNNTFIISRPLIREANYGRCDYTKFTVETVQQNLTPGTYTIRTYAKKRSYSSSNGTISTTVTPNLYIGGSAVNCTNLNNSLAKANQIINLVQKN